MRIIRTIFHSYNWILNRNIVAAIDHVINVQISSVWDVEFKYDAFFRNSEYLYVDGCTQNSFMFCFILNDK